MHSTDSSLLLNDFQSLSEHIMLRRMRLLTGIFSLENKTKLT